ncbi:MAG: NUDIX hydrolase [Rhodothermales bacterium]
MPNDTPSLSNEGRRWTTLSSAKLLERWWITLRADHVRLPSGVEMEEFHVAEYPDWALAVALTEDGQAVLVEQYRYAVDRVGLEFAAGVVHAGEPPLEAARRELLEETGYVANEWTALGRCAVEPSRHTNYGHLFVARGARRVGAPQLDETEDLRVRLVDAGDLAGLVERGEIVHGTHIAAVFWAMQRGLIGDGARSVDGG